MTTEDEKMILCNAKAVLFKHLDDLCDDVKNDGGQIHDHMTLKGMEDSLRSICAIMDIKSHV